LKRTAELLGLDGLLDRKPSQLSGGQQQRVALGRAIIAEAPVCLMDEPLSNLDAQLRQEMRSEIRNLQRQLGITMVYVTHDQVEAMSMADRVVLLNRGRIEQNAAPVELYERPANTFVARFIGTPPMNLLPLERGDGGAVIAGTEGPAVATADCAGSTLGVRPEHVAVALDRGVAGHRRSGRVSGRRLARHLPRGVGDARRAHVWKRRAQPGGSVRLAWAAGAQHVFAPDGRGARSRSVTKSATMLA
jgi:sn-glycerol 3-phosphate transport system ATP-binding protein